MMDNMRPAVIINDDTTCSCCGDTIPKKTAHAKGPTEDGRDIRVCYKCCPYIIQRAIEVNCGGFFRRPERDRRMMLLKWAAALAAIAALTFIAYSLP